MPNLPTRINTFARAQVGAIGKSLRSQERIEELYAICQPCENFTEVGPRKMCAVCACFLSTKRNRLNKLALPNMACPIGKFESES